MESEALDRNNHHDRIFKRDRETIRRYSEELIPALNAEIEVLTAERDSALLRIEELEARLAAWAPFFDGETVIPDWNASPRGGVNPNA